MTVNRALHKISEREDISKISFRFFRNNILKIFYLFEKIEEIYIWKIIFSPDQKIFYFSKYLLAKIEKIFFQDIIFIFSKIQVIFDDNELNLNNAWNDEIPNFSEKNCCWIGTYCYALIVIKLCLWSFDNYMVLIVAFGWAPMMEFFLQN